VSKVLCAKLALEAVELWQQAPVFVSNNVVAIPYINFGKGVTRISNKRFGLVYTKPEPYMARNLLILASY
jgi:hypothetical protein